MMAPTTTGPDQRDLRRGLRHESQIPVLADPAMARVLPCCKTSAGSELDVGWGVSRKSSNPTNKATIASMRRIAVHLPETIIGSLLDLHKGKPDAGASFIPGHHANLCRCGKIPRYQASGERQALGTAADPFGPADSAPMAGGQIYRGRANCSVCSVGDMIMGQAPPAHLAMHGVFGGSRPTEHATCKARRPYRGAHGPRQAQDIAHQHFTQTVHRLLANLQQQQCSMNMDPSSL
jgi:hypothetical protein